MDTIKINAKERPYNVYFDNSFSNFIKLCEEFEIINSKLVIIFDYNAYRFHGIKFFDALLEKGIDVKKYVIKSSEKIKTLNTVHKIYEFLYEINADRNTVIISFGGGIIGDVAGFVASTYKRGLKFIQVPTTLLACVDSSIGGKVGVNFKDKKNLVGSFYNPMFVYINAKVLETLNIREYNCGMVEIIKHALLLDEELFSKIESGNYDIMDIIKRSCEIKASIVTKDEKENSIRVILNLGHTIGHAIESLSDFKISHGEAVAQGILHSLEVSKKMGKMDEQQIKRIEKVFDNIGVLPQGKEEFDYDKIKEYIGYDKKIRDGILQYVLLNQIGSYEILQIKDINVLF